MWKTVAAEPESVWMLAGERWSNHCERGDPRIEMAVVDGLDLQLALEVGRSWAKDDQVRTTWSGRLTGIFKGGTASC